MSDATLEALGGNSSESFAFSVEDTTESTVGDTGFLFVSPEPTEEQLTAEYENGFFRVTTELGPAFFEHWHGDLSPTQLGDIVAMSDAISVDYTGPSKSKTRKFETLDRLFGTGMYRVTIGDEELTAEGLSGLEILNDRSPTVNSGAFTTVIAPTNAAGEFDKEEFVEIVSKFQPIAHPKYANYGHDMRHNQLDDHGLENVLFGPAFKKLRADIVAAGLEDPDQKSKASLLLDNMKVPLLTGERADHRSLDYLSKQALKFISPSSSELARRSEAFRISADQQTHLKHLLTAQSTLPDLF